MVKRRMRVNFGGILGWGQDDLLGFRILGHFQTQNIWMWK